MLPIAIEESHKNVFFLNLGNQRLYSLTSPPDKNTWLLKCSGEINESIDIFLNLDQSLLSKLTLPHYHWPFIQLELFPLSSCA